MKFWIRIFVAVAGSATFAFAAGEQREDGSSLAILLFLAFCALIVVGQLIPIFRTRVLQKKAQAAAKQAVAMDDGKHSN